MLGQNDDDGTFDQTGALNLVSPAKSIHYSELAFREVSRDRNARTGAPYMCTNIAQRPYDLSRIFAGYTG